MSNRYIGEMLRKVFYYHAVIDGIVINYHEQQKVRQYLTRVSVVNATPAMILRAALAN